jgi:thiamine kinase-like enzyme
MMLESICAPYEVAQAAIQEMYVDKTLARLNTLRRHPVLGKFFDQSVSINGARYSPLDLYLEQLRDVTGLLEPVSNSMSVIHGDLCISNILYDPRSRIIKLIDPRGKFGPWSMHGDYRYDLAKLSHSFNGNYEPIINDRFFLICQDTELSLTFNLGKYQEQVAKVFDGYLDRYFSKDIPSIQLIESLLFLSMIPLHADHLNHQIAFLAVGLQKLDACFRQRGIEL